MVTMIIRLCAWRIFLYLKSICTSSIQVYWNLIKTGVPIIEDGVVPREAQKETVEDLQLKNLKVKNYLFQAIDLTICRPPKFGCLGGCFLCEK